VGNRLVLLCVLLGVLVVGALVAAQPQTGVVVRAHTTQGVQGSVVSVDAAARTVEVESYGRRETYSVAEDATLTQAAPVQPSDLALGDFVEVHGYPMRFHADRGNLPMPEEALALGGQGRPVVHGTTRVQVVTQDGNAGGAAGPAPIYLGGGPGRLGGQVKSLTPLTLSVREGGGEPTDCEIEMSPDFVLTKEVAATLGDFEAGDRVRASVNITNRDAPVVRSLKAAPLDDDGATVFTHGM
jgi:hypothetical protein